MVKSIDGSLQRKYHLAMPTSLARVEYHDQPMEGRVRLRDEEITIPEVLCQVYQEDEQAG